VPAHVTRELVITVPLPDDKGLRRDGRPKVHRFRSQRLELGRQLRDFRARYGLTQDEVAAVVGTNDGTALAQWERGARVPDGLHRARLTELLDGRLWTELRASLIGGEGMPSRWNQGARWYRRASRERAPRERSGAVVAAVLDDLRTLGSPEALHRRYVEQDGEWAHALADQRGLGDASGADLRRIDDAAYGLRWLEVTRGIHVDLRRSLVPQLPLPLPGTEFRADRPNG
jgi:transcriptional regulator with XRE-family HTH domain